ncbi:hypothetical protein LZ757_06380 [Xylella fastidiosa subsp. morus]|nr:hypothetical protein [Xylella fastidiosa]UIT35712.1 hypothetical protein LZ757_06380 [Xylella fastidiosa subsp. morus]UIT38003.1 hypothetical protein LZ755_06390 [Xylella fastidiosa subsp. morus]
MLSGLINGAGWVIDELTHEVMSGSALKEIPIGTSVWWWQRPGDGHVFYSVTPQGLIAPINAFQGSLSPPQPLVVSSHVSSISSEMWAYILEGGGGFYSHLSKTTESVPDYSSGLPPSVILDTDLGQLVRSDPSTVNSVLTDSQTGAVLLTPEIVSALNKLRRSLETDGYQIDMSVSECRRLLASPLPFNVYHAYVTSSSSSSLSSSSSSSPSSSSVSSVPILGSSSSAVSSH